MKTFGIVFGYSFKERVRSKSFMMMTLLFVAIIAAIILVPKLFGSSATAQQGTVAVVNTSPLPIDAQSMSAAVSPNYTWKIVPESESSAQNTLLQQGELDAIVRISQPAEASAAPQIALSVNRQEDVSFAPGLSAYIERLNVNERVAELGVTTEQAASILAQPTFELNELNAGGKSTVETFMPVYALLMLMFFMIYLFAGNVATSVAVEKGSRIQEILITKVSPGQLLAGKVMGVGLAGILQFVIIFGVGALLISIGGDGETLKMGSLSIDLSILGGQTLAVTAALFVLGYFFYATLFAAAGSLVSRSEELNQAMLPVSLLLMAGFFISMIGLGDPNGTLTVVTSYIPFLTPMVLLTRVGAGDPTLMQILIPIAILMVSTLLVGWLSAKIYRGGVLLYGQKPSVGTMLKMLSSTNTKASKNTIKPSSKGANDAI
ncbi:ABC transporter permease [Saccharibacillus sp. JS10]|uniref:ABC transporter permease n=1 Tax=Saccharibacillus sp. JS10 TaxID=2950552 RepID=UPI0021093A5E|nr:ABC transporter permease [Saccharibacillus sp. JS10]MCQ4087435.1 ABC transporter permease [Saccharibacillus sp. JS10]